MLLRESETEPERVLNEREIRESEANVAECDATRTRQNDRIRIRLSKLE